MSNWNKAAIALMATMLIVATVAIVGLTVAVNGLNSRIDRVEETLDSLALEGVRMTTGEVGGELAQETGTITADRQTATPRPMATATPEPTATATLPPAPAKSSAQENICGRNPWVQQQLLAYLKMTSCRDATIEELYRLSGEYRNFQVKGTLKPGDFEGLVNITSLAVTVKAETGDPEIPANAFHGMEGLESLRVSGRIATIKAGAFQGLPNLEKLDISQLRPETRLEDGALAGMP